MNVVVIMVVMVMPNTKSNYGIGMFDVLLKKSGDVTEVSNRY
jgi:hypothetical protein